MSYFKNFPNTLYTFASGDAITTNLAAYAEILDQVRISSTFYQDYHIMNGERPDHVAFKFYNDPQLHWVFFLMNPVLRENGWPMSSEEILSKVKKDHPNHTITINEDITTTLHVGQVIQGYSSESTGTIVHRNLDLGQITVRTDGPFQQGELIKDVATGDVYTFTVAAATGEHLAAHHYELDGEWFDINPYASLPPTVVKVTNLDYYISENNKMKQIRIIKPSSINTVVSAFKKAMNS